MTRTADKMKYESNIWKGDSLGGSESPDVLSGGNPGNDTFP